MTVPDEIAALVPVAEAFEAMEVNYYIGGSMASSVHGVSRATADADLVADLKHEHVDELVHRIRDQYYVSPESIHQAIDQRGSFNLIHLTTQFKVDVFALKDRLFDWYAARRHEPQQLLSGVDRRFPIASPEDVVLTKLEWFAKTDQTSSRQWADILNVLRLQRERIDRGYLIQWARELGVADLMTKVLAEADQLDQM